MVIERPGYGPLVDVAHYLGAHVRRIERRFENDFAISLGEMESAISSATRLVVLTNLHNPSGALVPRETLQEIGARAARVGAVVLMDEVYLEMLFDSSAPFYFSLVKNFGVKNRLPPNYGLCGRSCG